MTVPYYADESVTLYHGKALDVIRGLPDGSVDCCVTSPPYFGLRDYGAEGQYGAEASPAEFVERLRVLFGEVRRVLADDGTCWLNLGDSYASTKDLMGMPWRTAFALQGDGWILRNDIIWAKPKVMPVSVQDRLNTVHEHLFLFAKSRRYWFDLDPIRDAPRMDEQDVQQKRRSVHAPNRLAAENGHTRAGRSRPISEVMGSFDEIKGRNPGDVWTVATQPFPDAHFAVMPPELAGRAIQSGCKPGGVVLDPFSGSGTTGLAATKHGRRYVGIDLNAEYLALSLRTRLAQTALLDGAS